MPHPKHRRTSSDRKRRAAHFGLKTKNLSVCSNCKQPVLSHHACQSCGTYNGRQVVDTSRQLTRKLGRAQAKIAAATKPQPKAEAETKPAKAKTTKSADKTENKDASKK